MCSFSEKLWEMQYVRIHAVAGINILGSPPAKGYVKNFKTLINGGRDYRKNCLQGEPPTPLALNAFLQSESPHSVVQ